MYILIYSTNNNVSLSLRRVRGDDIISVLSPGDASDAVKDQSYCCWRAGWPLLGRYKSSPVAFFLPAAAAY